MIDMSEIVLPSNRKFGFFFASVFALAFAYFSFHEEILPAYLFGISFLAILVVTSFKPDALLPFNKLWMKIGVLLSMIISPIVFGVIFFGIITPVGIFIRLIGRDELRMRNLNGTTNWINRTHQVTSESFRQQF